MQFFSAMQDLYVNMPYQGWEMMPHGPNHTLLTIIGGMVAIFVEIKVLHSHLQNGMWFAYKLIVLSFTWSPTHINPNHHPTLSSPCIEPHPHKSSPCIEPHPHKSSPCIEPHPH